MTAAASFRAATRPPILQVAKTAAATLLAWFACTLVFPEQLPVFGAIAALLCVQPSVTQSVGRAVERVVGVIAGVAVASGALFVFGAASWLFIVAILASALLGWAARMTTPSSNQIAITAMLVLALGGTTEGYALERIVETAIGAAIGLIVNAVIAAPVLVTPAHEALLDLREGAAGAMDRLARELDGAREQSDLRGALVEARALRERMQEVVEQLAASTESLALNPRRSRWKDAAERDQAMARLLNPIVQQVAGMTRAVHDHAAPGLLEEPEIAGIAEELRRAAHDLRTLGEPSAAAEPPALTRPFTVVQPHPLHWIVLGSLLEDLRRIREAIVEARDAS